MRLDTFLLHGLVPRTETILIGVSRRVKFLTVPKSGFTAARIPNEVADSTFEVRKRTLCGADMISRRRCIREGVEDRAEAERYTVADVVVRRLQGARRRLACQALADCL
jgi:hypothetical protein